MIFFVASKVFKSCENGENEIRLFSLISEVFLKLKSAHFEGFEKKILSFLRNCHLIKYSYIHDIFYMTSLCFKLAKRGFPDDTEITTQLSSLRLKIYLN